MLLPQDTAVHVTTMRYSCIRHDSCTRHDHGILTAVHVTVGAGFQCHLPGVGDGGVTQTTLGDVGAEVEAHAGEGGLLHTQLGALLRRHVGDDAVVSQLHRLVGGGQELVDVVSCTRTHKQITLIIHSHQAIICRQGG